MLVKRTGQAPGVGSFALFCLSRPMFSDGKGLVRQRQGSCKSDLLKDSSSNTRAGLSFAGYTEISHFLTRCCRSEKPCPVGLYCHIPIADLFKSSYLDRWDCCVDNDRTGPSQASCTANLSKFLLVQLICRQYSTRTPCCHLSTSITAAEDILGGRIVARAACPAPKSV